MKVLIGSDHAGFALKEELKSAFPYEWVDCGAHSTDSVDYPEFAHRLAEALLDGKADRGVLVCGSGIGISIAANRHNGIRAALCTSVEMAKLSREHNNANVIVFGERIIDWEIAKKALETFMATEFEGGRHERRVEKIDI